MKRQRTLVGAAALALALAACSSDGKSNNGSETTLTTNTEAPTTASANTESVPTTPLSVSGTVTEQSTEARTSNSASVSDRIDQAQQALQDGNFSAMLQALKLSGVADEINDRAVTILAPTNDAFTNVPGDVARDLVTNPTKIDDIIKRHILDGTYTLDDLKAKSEVKTIGGDTLTVTNDGGTLKIDGAVVTQPKDSKFTGENGQELAVFQIDKVLLPSG